MCDTWLYSKSEQVQASGIRLIWHLTIIGSRTCPQLDIEAYMKCIPDTIISGGAKGADTYAKEFANKHNLKLVEYLPEYDKYPPKVAPQMSQWQAIDIMTYNSYSLQYYRFWKGKKCHRDSSMTSYPSVTVWQFLKTNFCVTGVTVDRFWKRIFLRYNPYSLQYYRYCTPEK